MTGRYVRCDVCGCAMWLDTTHGERPGPDLCGQDCYDAHEGEASRRLPGWAVNAFHVD